MGVKEEERNVWEKCWEIPNLKIGKNSDAHSRPASLPTWFFFLYLLAFQLLFAYLFVSLPTLVKHISVTKRY